MKGNGQSPHNESRAKLWPPIRNVAIEVTQRLVVDLIRKKVITNIQILGRKLWDVSPSDMPRVLPLSILFALERSDRDPRVTEWENLLRALKEKGADLDVFSILRGWHRDLENGEHVDVFFDRYERINWDLVILRAMQENRQRLMQRLRRYRALQNALKNDPLSVAVKSELGDMVTVLEHLLGRYGNRTLGDGWLNLHPTVDVSRQNFWGPPIRILVNELSPHFPTRAETYRTVARLLHLAFPAFPDDWDLVKQRYTREMRRLSGGKHKPIPRT